MTFRHAVLIHSRFRTTRRPLTPEVVLTAATIVAAVLFLATAGAARADGNGATGSGCASLTALTLTAVANQTTAANRTSSSGDCSFRASVIQANKTSTPSGASSNPCKVTFTPSPIGNTGVRVRVSHEGECNNIEMRWRVYPPSAQTPSAPPSNVPRGASASRQSSAYAYLLGEDVVGIDMIKNWSTATWTHDTERVLSVTHYPSLWGTTHEFHFIGLYWGDGWTVESKSSGTIRHGDSRVEAWSNGNFHIHIPALPDSRARTRSELHAQANSAFYCDFELQWINSYAFTSESDCARK